LFAHAGGRVTVLPGRDPAAPARETFGERLSRLPAEEGLTADDGVIVLGGGAVPLLMIADGRRLVETARSAAPLAITNNRYSSDIVAIGRVAVLRDLPPLPSDNALPRWLEERAGVRVGELPGRDRLAIDLDTPGDVALAAHIPGIPSAVRRMAAADGLTLPRLEELRALARDPRRELLVAGRSGSRTLAWLERNVRCRVRFLAEERGLRASSDLAIGGTRATGADGATAASRPPRTTLGRLLAERGPDALADLVGELADGAILDTRVLLADHLGPDEEAWPVPEDRYASDLLRPAAIGDPWLRTLTASAAAAPIPILLGAHTLIGPGIRHLLG
jgi:CTP:molybdopterin cytidylyltransferase MocA